MATRTIAPITKTIDKNKRIALVTGTSSGIGEACATRLTAGGWQVYGGSRTGKAERSNATHDVARNRWQALELDVTSDASVASAVRQVISEAGRIDALVHCAGISIAGAIEDVTIAEAEKQFATNYFGTVRTIQTALGPMRRQGAGSIIVIGSIGGLIALPYIAHYSASKFALDGLVQALRMEIAPFGLEATIVHPGDIRTQISVNQVEGEKTGTSSAYRPAFRHAVDAYTKAVNEAREPDVIAAKVAAVLERRRMPARVIAGTPMEAAGVYLKSVLPSRWFEVILAKSYGIGTA